MRSHDLVFHFCHLGLSMTFLHSITDESWTKTGQNLANILLILIGFPVITGSCHNAFKRARRLIKCLREILLFACRISLVRMSSTKGKFLSCKNSLKQSTYCFVARLVFKVFLFFIKVLFVRGSIMWNLFFVDLVALGPLNSPNLNISTIWVRDAWVSIQINFWGFLPPRKEVPHTCKIVNYF